MVNPEKSLTKVREAAAAPAQSCGELLDKTESHVQRSEENIVPDYQRDVYEILTSAKNTFLPPFPALLLQMLSSSPAISCNESMGSWRFRLLLQ